ncbi:DUF3325 family protein [Galbibacter mesophilus]|uniref:DUF3325 family protein n=1 Tax=Galbibacter mesophilus TaxID=379069 RepID=UPI00191F28AA|nr:hypothetical protein [Galbibacter mesophilus]MCM5661418.1 hypothetical protein [Galbibacter mesophilus]
MISLIIFLIFIGFYALYNSSKRAALNTSKIEVWLQKNLKISKVTAILLLSISLVLSIFENGFASGTLLWFILLMTLGSLTILLAPLKIMSYKTVLVVFTCILWIENFIF